MPLMEYSRCKTLIEGDPLKLNKTSISIEIYILFKLIKFQLFLLYFQTP